MSFTNPTELQEFLEKIFKFRLCFLTIISVFIILGNSLVLLATWKERTLHEPNKYFVACLAVADLLIGGFLGPLSAHKDTMFLKAQFDKKSIHRCRFETWITILALTASVFTLALISVDRYVKISQPLQYKQRMTTSICLKLILIVWLMSSVLATYAITPFSGGPGGSIWCPDVPYDVNKIKVFLTIYGTCLLLSTVMILIMYTLIFFVAHKRQKILRNGGLGETDHEQNQRSNGGLGETDHERNQISTFLQDLKVIRALFLVAGMYLVCWYPYIIWLFLSTYFSENIFWNNWKLIVFVILMADLLRFVDSLCNPIIYTCLHEKYKVALKRLFQQMKSLVCQTKSEV